MSQFTHIHVHTQYSILDGASNIKKLLSRVKDLGMTSIAITDHGNMFGVKQFHETATKMGIKPILGCETYVARRSRHLKDNKELDARGWHLVLLAKNIEGYHNLIKMVSYSWLEGQYYTARIDKELLEKYNKGIICCSACLGGEVPQHIMSGDIEAAEASAQWFKNIFGDDYYLELQLHKSGVEKQDKHLYENQLLVNKELLRIGKKLGIKCISSNDIHFVNEEDAVAHDHLICLNTGKNLDDPDRMRYTGQEFLKSTEQMLSMFPNNPELIANTQEIADKIESYSLSHSAFMPDFPLPDDFIVDNERFKKVLCNSVNEFVKKSKDEVLTVQGEKICSEIMSCPSQEELTTLLFSAHERYDKRFDMVERRAIARQYIYLEHITFEGAKMRYGDMDQSTRERIEFELEVIEKMGFPGYFLIVWDFIAAGRRMGVSVGPGRGSAAGSVVAYCLKITSIDPIKYDLLFERFLNPERISMPDIDIDFDEDGRESVMKYVVNKYGATRVAHIITFGTMGAKNAIRDVARVQQLPLPESNRLSKLVPEKPGTKLIDAFKEVKELDLERNSDDPKVRNTLKYAETLEGSVRQTGVHACGVIIAKDNLENFVPVSTAAGAELYVVQYDGHYVEDIGLLKMDFLGLKTLSIIKDAVRNVKESKGIDIDIDTVPLDDELTFELYSTGNTTGIFQFESPGMKKHLRALKPNKFEDLIAMNALYRPGPMDYIPSFINRKLGTEPIKYDIDDMKEYLENTYGITVYQEQVMLLSQKLAGFTKGQADTLRKAMGKKQRDVLDKMKGTFIDGATSKGYDKDVCVKIWTDWEAFASYAFNKSHSTCYAYVSYQTAYIKAHYPSEFMAAVLSRNFSDIKKISFFMDECRNLGLPIKGPDVNKSRLEFSVDRDGNIRFGLSAIKGVGTSASEAIISEREKNGEYKDLYDFIERIDMRAVGKKTIENLVVAGAFESLSTFHRSLFLVPTTDEKDTFIERWVNYGASYQSEMTDATQSLFGGFEDTIDLMKKPNLPNPSATPWTQLATLSKEKELIGMYVSSHPLDAYKFIVEKMTNMQLLQLENPDEFREKDFRVAGMVSSVTIATTKKETQYCKMMVEDYNGSYEFAFFGSDFDKFRNYYHENNQILITGKITQRFKDAPYSAKVSTIISLQEAKDKMIHRLVLRVNVKEVTDEMISNLDNIISENVGDTPVVFTIYDVHAGIYVDMVSKKYRIDVNSQLINSLALEGIDYQLN